jgi:hypothetical protein
MISEAEKVSKEPGPVQVFGTPQGGRASGSAFTRTGRRISVFWTPRSGCCSGLREEKDLSESRCAK